MLVKFLKFSLKINTYIVKVSHIYKLIDLYVYATSACHFKQFEKIEELYFSYLSQFCIYTY